MFLTENKDLLRFLTNCSSFLSNEMFLSDWEHTDSMIPDILAFAVPMLLIIVELTKT